ncbi:MAG: ImmA/IrrE family metallo-endopeptidase [Bacilli bacterium]
MNSITTRSRTIVTSAHTLHAEYGLPISATLRWVWACIKSDIAAKRARPTLERQIRQNDDKRDAWLSLQREPRNLHDRNAAVATVQEVCAVARHPFDRRIEALYQQRGFRTPADIALPVFGLEVEGSIRIIERSGRTYVSQEDEKWIIWLDTELSPQERRHCVAHETGHILLHVGNQMWMAKDLILRQEEEAIRFSHYALVPTYLLAPELRHRTDIRRKDIEELAEIFGVTESFMLERLRVWALDQGDQQENTQIAYG